MSPELINLLNNNINLNENNFNIEKNNIFSIGIILL